MNEANIFDVTTFDITRYDELLSNGLPVGIGKPKPGEMCIEAVICNVMGLPHNDNPKCVALSVRLFKIKLNDSNWSSNLARANGLRDLGLAQLGSLGVVDDIKFVQLLSKKIIQVLIPNLFRRVFPNDKKCLDAAKSCERGDIGAAEYAATNAAEYTAAKAAEYAATNAAEYAATNAAYTAAKAAEYAATNAAEYAYYAAEYAAKAAKAAKYAAEYADRAAGYAAYTAAKAAKAANAAEYAAKAEYAALIAGDYYLILAAKLALEILQELNSPGCELLNTSKGIA